MITFVFVNIFENLGGPMFPLFFLKSSLNSRTFLLQLCNIPDIHVSYQTETKYSRFLSENSVIEVFSIRLKKSKWCQQTFLFSLNEFLHIRKIMVFFRTIDLVYFQLKLFLFLCMGNRFQSFFRYSKLRNVIYFEIISLMNDQLFNNTLIMLNSFET